MQNMNQKPENSSEYFELKDIYNYILLNKNIIFIVTGLFAILSIIISLNLPNKFTSSALLTINKNNFTNNRQTSSSAFSNISGLLLPSEDYAKSIYGIEIFKSRELIYEFTDEPEVLINLFASEGWDRNSGEVLIDQNIYDSIEKNGSEMYLTQNKKPSKLEAHKIFTTEVLNVDMDEASGFVLLSVTHVSPVVARDWAVRLINLTNDKVRRKDIEFAEKSIDFLTSELAFVEVEDVRRRIFDLIESQISKISLAKANQEYLFDVIDQPVVTEIKSGPSRSLICIFGTILGFFLSLMISISKDLYRKITK